MNKQIQDCVDMFQKYKYTISKEEKRMEDMKDIYRHNWSPKNRDVVQRHLMAKVELRCSALSLEILHKVIVEPGM